VTDAKTFDSYYQNLFSGRWQDLRAALVSAERQVARWNQFVPLATPPELGAAFTALPQSYLLKNSSDIPRSTENLLCYYVMDPASQFAARALDVQAGDAVLDMCAAPGGKTLILAEALRDEGELLANEMSEARRERLKKVIQQYIPRDVRDRVWVTGKDGGKFALTHKEKFDRILVDAPCSGERHLLASAKDLAEWSPSRSEKLAQRQYALLTAALLAVKPGGRIVYSTCALSPLENDGVIARLLKKKAGFRVLPAAPPVPEAERTEFGLQFLPDRCGYGPIFYSVLEKSFSGSRRPDR
jgi:16S rRNA C967 or C1407 C5-methylase (RsmB/RsmF family)